MGWLARISTGLTLGTLGALSACEDGKPPRADLFGFGGSAGSAGTDGASGATSSGGSLSFDAGPVEPPPPDASGLCGSLVVQVYEPPNVYFVIDRSGSMSEPLPGGLAKYVQARLSIADVLRVIGHRINYGATIFPGLSSTECGPGSEIFPTQPGDPPLLPGEPDGPVLFELLAKLGSVSVEGATPTSATMEAVRPRLSALEGETYVVLTTDGGPNCNPSAVCGASECILNIEDALVPGLPECTPDFNCCAPENGATVLNCLDRPASVAAIQRLALDNIKTYVVGMPGSEPYTNTLNQMAQAGQTARGADTDYYAVTDPDTLTAALTQIGLEIAVSCDLELAEAPPDKGLVNVYFDQDVVAFDAADGWAWNTDTTIQLRGAACERLRSGNVRQVQVAAGCPTEVK